MQSQTGNNINVKHLYILTKLIFVKHEYNLRFVIDLSKSLRNELDSLIIKRRLISFVKNLRLARINSPTDFYNLYILGTGELANAESARVNSIGR